MSRFQTDYKAKRSGISLKSSDMNIMTSLTRFMNNKYNTEREVQQNGKVNNLTQNSEILNIPSFSKKREEYTRRYKSPDFLKKKDKNVGESKKSLNLLSATSSKKI